MDSRLKLHKILTDIMIDIDPSYGANHVYFQPPESMVINYPCIVYERSTGDTQFADDNSYIFKIRYQITAIDINPDSKIFQKIAMIPGATMDRHYVADNLHHDVFNLYF